MDNQTHGRKIANKFLHCKITGSAFCLVSAGHAEKTNFISGCKRFTNSMGIRISDTIVTRNTMCAYKCASRIYNSKSHGSFFNAKIYMNLFLYFIFNVEISIMMNV